MSRNGETLFALLVRAHAIALALGDDLLRECGVSVLEAWLLEEITADGDLCASAIARQLEVPTSTVTRALRRLESHGYVTLRKGTVRDSRVLRAQLTPYGAGIRRHVLGFEHDLDRMLLRDMRPVELGAFLVALTRILNCPRTVADQPPPPDPPPYDLGQLTYASFAPRRPPPDAEVPPPDRPKDERIDPLTLF